LCHEVEIKPEYKQRFEDNKTAGMLMKIKIRSGNRVGIFLSKPEIIFSF